MHMMIREIIPGRQQRVRRCPLQTVTVAGILISSVKVLATLTWAEADRCGWTSGWRWIIGASQSGLSQTVGHVLKGHVRSNLTSCSRLLSPPHPTYHAYTRIHSSTKSPPLLG